MRTIRFTEPDNDWWREWKDTCNAATEARIRAYREGERLVVDRRLYRQHKYDFLMSKTGPFRGKCAYCDADISRQHGNIEHYRPEGAVHDDDDKPVTRIRDGRTETHPGYYWLVYDWRNLLPSCQLCNVGNSQMSTGAKPGKRNRFPVASAHGWEPGAEREEHPMLINPTVDEPDRHIMFDSTGWVTKVDERGSCSIKILGLNDYDLPEDRRRRYLHVYRQVTNHIKARRLDEPDEGEETELQRVVQGFGNFTAMGLIAIEDATRSARDQIREEQERQEDAIRRMGHEP